MTHRHITRSQAQGVQPTLIDLPEPTPYATAFSAPRRGILSSPSDHLSQEDSYLVKWLSSRLEPTTLTLREDSALTATASDRRQIARLLAAARARGLSLFADANAEVA